MCPQFAVRAPEWEKSGHVGTGYVRSSGLIKLLTMNGEKGNRLRKL